MDPVRDADPQARQLARDLLMGARTAACAYLTPGTGLPGIARIAFALDPDGCPLSLVSALSAHTGALRDRPDCALLVGEPGAKGDPLTHPRLMLRARAGFVERATAEHETCRKHWLAAHPKSRLYVDFADFAFVRFAVADGVLNGGFGKAFRLQPKDLA
jgi:heme iron utilization protein